ncbi:hypothetical protein TUM19329_32220 [Legionella antarctica]|uniref:Uncharacterized protein n=1 Tax=Legionella antarctica TaxID=2708020 RepID=A0A6F8T8T2_9GAMM|nr:hypothetical protein [Legionella antarctica]BCA96861.1 hypothetical protein TUM19329_32220 [Legionella antarctica]
MPKKLRVDMDQMLFTSDEETVLITNGITTCIAFIAQGSFWDEEEDDMVDFCGLYHWSGFRRVDTPLDQQAKNALLYFFKTLTSYTGIDRGEKITIDTLCFIGGEKEQRDSDNGLIVTGTEAEVYLLKQAVREFNFVAHQFIIASENISHHHFLTEGEQSISIKLTLDAINCKVESPEPYNSSEEELHQENLTGSSSLSSTLM